MFNHFFHFILFQTPKDPSSRENFCCHGHQTNPSDFAADLYFHCTLTAMPTTEDVACVHRWVWSQSPQLVNIQTSICAGERKEKSVKKILFTESFGTMVGSSVRLNRSSADRNHLWLAVRSSHHRPQLNEPVWPPCPFWLDLLEWFSYCTLDHIVLTIVRIIRQIFTQRLFTSVLKCFDRGLILNV